VKVGALRVEFFVPGASSLKAKRQVVKSVKDRLRNRFNVSVAEVDYLDKWQRAALGLSAAGAEGAYVRGILDAALDFLRGESDIQVAKHEIEVL
jgi:uncharacterized protein YlxP (DUF503 family)